MSALVRVELPQHLRTLAGVTGHEVQVDVAAPVTLRAVLEAIEVRWPALRGTIRDHETGNRRPFLRFFAGGEDISHEATDTALPEAIARGDEALLVIGAIAGG